MCEAISPWILPQVLALVAPDIPGAVQAVSCTPSRVQIIQVVMRRAVGGSAVVASSSGSSAPRSLQLSDKEHTVEAHLSTRCSEHLASWSGARLRGAVAQLKQFYWTVAPAGAGHGSNDGASAASDGTGQRAAAAPALAASLPRRLVLRIEEIQVIGGGGSAIFGAPSPVGAHEAVLAILRGLPHPGALQSRVLHRQASACEGAVLPGHPRVARFVREGAATEKEARAGTQGEKGQQRGHAFAASGPPQPLRLADCAISAKQAALLEQLAGWGEVSDGGGARAMLVQRAQQLELQEQRQMFHLQHLQSVELLRQQRQLEAQRAQSEAQRQPERRGNGRWQWQNSDESETK